MNASSWVSAQLRAFLVRERAKHPPEEPFTAEILSLLNCPYPNPWQCRYFGYIDHTLSVRDDLFADYPDSPSLGLQIALQLAKSSDVLALAQIGSLNLPKDRAEFYTARILERSGRIAEASVLYEQWLSSGYIPLHSETAKRLARAYLELGRYEACLQLIAKSYLYNPLV